MRTGMKALLGLHNHEELRILCKSLKIHGKRTKGSKIQAIIDTQLNSDQESYKRMLHSIWEGILIEYLRSVGKKIRSYTSDPRNLIFKHWLRGTEAQNEGWTRVYVPPTDGLKENETTDDPIILEHLAGIKEREDALKETERSIRQNRDYLSAIRMFDHMALIRIKESALRKHLIVELEKTREQFFMCQIREAGANSQSRLITGRYQALVERSAKIETRQDVELDTYFAIAADQSMVNQMFKSQYVDMMDRARDQDRDTWNMREKLEESQMRLSHLESSLFKARSDAVQSRSHERMTERKMNDLIGVFSSFRSKAIKKLKRRKKELAATVGLLVAGQVERLALKARDDQTRAELQNCADMTREELEQRREAELIILEAKKPKKKKKRGRKGKRSKSPKKRMKGKMKALLALGSKKGKKGGRSKSPTKKKKGKGAKKK